MGAVVFLILVGVVTSVIAAMYVSDRRAAALLSAESVDVEQTRFREILNDLAEALELDVQDTDRGLFGSRPGLRAYVSQAAGSAVFAEVLLEFDVPGLTGFELTGDSRRDALERARAPKLGVPDFDHLFETRISTWEGGVLVDADMRMGLQGLAKALDERCLSWRVEIARERVVISTQQRPAAMDRTWLAVLSRECVDVVSQLERACAVDRWEAALEFVSLISEDATRLALIRLLIESISGDLAKCRELAEALASSGEDNVRALALLVYGEVIGRDERAELSLAGFANTSTEQQRREWLGVVRTYQEDDSELAEVLTRMLLVGLDSDSFEPWMLPLIEQLETEEERRSWLEYVCSVFVEESHRGGFASIVRSEASSVLADALERAARVSTIVDLQVALSPHEIAPLLLAKLASAQLDSQSAFDKAISTIARDLEALALGHLLSNTYLEDARVERERLLDALDALRVTDERDALGEMRALLARGVESLSELGLIIESLERRASVREARELLGVWRSAPEHDADFIATTRGLIPQEEMLRLCVLGVSCGGGDEVEDFLEMMAALCEPSEELDAELFDGVTMRWWFDFSSQTHEEEAWLDVRVRLMRMIAARGDEFSRAEQLCGYLEATEEDGMLPIMVCAATLWPVRMRSMILERIEHEELDARSWRELFENVFAVWSREDIVRLIERKKFSEAVWEDLLAEQIEREPERGIALALAIVEQLPPTVWAVLRAVDDSAPGDHVRQRVFDAAASTSQNIAYMVENIERSTLDAPVLEALLLRALDSSRGEQTVGIVEALGLIGSVACIHRLTELSSGFFSSGELKYRVEKAIAAIQERANLSGEMRGGLSLSESGDGKLTIAGEAGRVTVVKDHE